MGYIINGIKKVTNKVTETKQSYRPSFHVKKTLWQMPTTSHPLLFKGCGLLRIAQYPYCCPAVERRMPGRLKLGLGGGLRC